MKSKVINIILGVLIVATVVGVITAVVIGTKNKNIDDPDVTIPPVTDTPTETTEPDDTDPVVPPVPTDEPGTDDTGTDKPDETTEPVGEVHIDVVGENQNTKDDEPKIEGEVVIIPGIKDEGEGNEQ